MKIPFLPLALLSLLAAADSVLAQAPPTLARSLSAELGAQGRLIWIDGTANVTRTVKVNGVSTVTDYTTTREGVRDVVRKCKAAHATTLVVDVKPLSGQVLYASKIAPHMTEWKGHKLPEFDVLAAFIEEGHKAGLQVDACVNILSEGHKYYSAGPAYAHPDWQSIVYTVDRGMNAPNGARLSIRAPGEPDDPNKPVLLTDATTILGSEPTSGLVGLESTDSKQGSVSGNEASSLGKQLNITLDADNRVTGIVDTALLGDDPLSAPEDGHLLTTTRESDRAWITQNLKAGAVTRFDQRSTRTPIAQAPSEKVACFVNPLHPDARRHEMEIVREIVGNYAIDGLVLDRCRYSNLYNDFSDRSRDAFAQWLQARGGPFRVHRWPEDVFTFPQTPGGPLKEGPLYKLWLEFRAQVIHDFVADVARTARSVKPQIVLGSYVGSWYPRYYEVGVNWGSEKTPLRYPWFTANYPKTGYAEFFDWISTGCYYPTATEEEARDQGQSPKGTVEFAASLSNTAVASGAFVYAGIYVPDYATRPDVFLRALDAAARQTQGWMIFDISQMDEFNFWPLLEKMAVKETRPPDAMTALLPALRAAADAAQ